MATVRNDIYAALVGIDSYLGEYQDLSGCINDVNTVKRLLHEKIHVPLNNISTLTSPLQSSQGQLPTKKNVLQLIDNTAERAISHGPDALLFIHYSGHGSRSRTTHPDKKKGDFDEALCTMGETLTDVEISDLLEKYGKKNLAIFMVLDCCHSGGADRVDDKSLGAVRCPSPPNQADVVALAGDRGERNAVVQVSWFSRARHHNLLAACQPNEVARERANDNNQTTGVLTYYFEKALNSLLDSKEPITYETFKCHLESLCKVGNKQQPMHLGDGNRLLFSTRLGQSYSGDLQGNIINTLQEKDKSLKAVIDKGYSHGVRDGDRFHLYAPNQCQFGVLNPKAQHAAEAEIFQCKDTRSTAKVSLNKSGDGLQLAKGWFARRVQRANPYIVYFDANSQNSAHGDQFSRLKVEWEQLMSGPSQPRIDLKFELVPDMPQDTAALQVKVAQKDMSLSFYGNDGKIMENVPSLRLDDEKIAKKLAYLVPRLCSYQSLAALRPASSAQKPSYEFSIIKREDEGDEDDEYDEDDEHVNSPKGPKYEVKFQNKSESTVFITIFNLGPAYGISQIFPGEGASSFEVGSGEKIPELLIRLSVPNLLKGGVGKPDFRMCEKFKALVTLKKTQFGHYIQPDLEDWNTWKQNSGQGYNRNANTVQKKPEEFWTELEEINISGRDLTNVSGTPDYTFEKQPKNANDDLNIGKVNISGDTNSTISSVKPHSNIEVTAQPVAPSTVGLGWYTERPSGWDSD